MANRNYILSSSPTPADLSWEEKNNGSYLLKEDVLRDLQDALKNARAKLNQQEEPNR